MQNVDQGSNITIVFNDYSDRLSCCARMFKADENAIFEPVGATELTIPQAYLFEGKFTDIIRSFETCERHQEVVEPLFLDEERPCITEDDLTRSNRRSRDEIRRIVGSLEM